MQSLQARAQSCYCHPVTDVLASLATVENGTGAGESSALMKHWKNSIRLWGQRSFAANGSTCGSASGFFAGRDEARKFNELSRIV
jgi:hypothetical protein